MNHPLPTREEIAQLPPDGGDKYNRLVFEASPYLRQHAVNPVDWRAWGPEAFEEARRLDRPVFLSIGYSTCHWCHVMNRESFADPNVAALMNEAFINIKVDREERPDVDNVYMEVTMALTGSGGWPMTVVMTPDKKPFFAGTYFPKNSIPGRIGMLDLVPALSEAWKDKRGEVLESATQITDAVAARHGESGSTNIDAKILAAADEMFLDQYDEIDGGFGQGRMKFPMPHYILHLLQRHRRTGRQDLLDAALHTLRRMREGGVHDQVGFGFHRYATDREWLLPHFEKMLYDNALLMAAYTEAAAVAPDGELHLKVAREIAEYLARDLTSPGGAFYSAEDADSEGEEGKFYVWTKDELVAVLGEKDAARYAERYRFSDDGNFFEESTGVKSGANIPHLAAGTLSKNPGAVVDPEFEAMRVKLLAAREKRVRPHRDEKILADWNGLAIAGLSRLAVATNEKQYSEAASSAADFVLRELRAEDGRLVKRWADGLAGAPPTLEDYAFLCWGLLELYQATFELRWLQEAARLAEIMVKDFADAERGGFYQTAHGAEALIFRPRDVHDGAIPSGNSIAAWCLLRLHRLTGETSYRDTLQKLLEGFFNEIARNPMGHACSLMALDDYAAPSREIVLVGERGTEEFETLASVARKHAPGAAILHRPAGDAADLVRLAPFAEPFALVDNKPAAYVCEGFACRQPVTGTGELKELLKSARLSP